jgi:DNA-directed RNA polymerase subunit M/transcription elongation factor TFIIS
MRTPIIFADHLDSCPKCGGTELQSFWIENNGLLEFYEVKCARCGRRYPARDYYERELQKKMDSCKQKVIDGNN